MMCLARLIPSLEKKANSISLSQAVNSKDFARIGDAIVNFVFSMAVSEISGCGKTVRVLDRHLAEAARMTSIAKMVKSKKKNAGEVGDAAEATIAYHMIRVGNYIDEMTGETEQPESVQNAANAKINCFVGAVGVTQAIQCVSDILRKFGNKDPGELEVVEALVVLLKNAKRDLKKLDSLLSVD